MAYQKFEKIKEICSPLKDYDEDLYEVCVEDGYEIARDTIMAEMDNLEHLIKHDPEEALYEYHLSPRDIKCLRDKGVSFDFTEQDVYYVLEGAVNEMVRDLENGWIPDFYDTMTALSESSFSNNLWDVINEKIENELRECYAKNL